MHQIDQQHEVQIRALPCWQSPIAISELGGGITNHNYLVENRQGRYVVRLGFDIPVHQILRFNEMAASRAAYAAGIAPRVVYGSEGVLVLEYIEAPALTPEAVRDPERLQRIVTLLQRCHREVPLYLRGASLVFWVFHVIRDYAATLREGGSQHVAMLGPLLEQATSLERAAAPFDIVFGHNDLLAANLLDDGDRLWLIDREYAGFNTPLFDLGGLASNNGLDEAAEHWLIDAYFGETKDTGLWRRYQAMKCASLLRETLWSMVSEIHSTLSFDYSAYTRDNLERYQQTYARFRATLSDRYD